MAIIGRLDEQTAAVLIEPVTRRLEPHADSDAAPDKLAPPPARAQAPKHEPGTRDSDRQHAASTELPVWLL
jgi:hypothetical protein